MSDHWDAILASAPLNATAAKVTGKGVAFEPSVTYTEHSWDVPPTLARITAAHRANSSFTDLTGHRVGRLLVLGLAVGGAREARGGLWVCKCSCGRYVGRRAKALKTVTPEASMCNACAYTQRLRENGGSTMARQRAESDKARKWQPATPSLSGKEKTE